MLTRTANFKYTKAYYLTLKTPNDCIFIQTEVIFTLMPFRKVNVFILQRKTWSISTNLIASANHYHFVWV